MLQLRVVGEQERLSGIGTWLEGADHVRNTVLVPAFPNVDNGLLLADVGSELTTEMLAYLDESGVNQQSRASGAPAVLCVNVAMLLIGGTSTLAIQRGLNRHAGVDLESGPQLRREGA